jgi:ABC-type branched-subunit amino acid transport system permease subunit
MLITPDIPSLGQMFLVLAMAVIGEDGRFTDPILGSFILEVLSEYIPDLWRVPCPAFGLVAWHSAVCTGRDRGPPHKKMGKKGSG